MLTQYCELDRSTMYKFINGKRTPATQELVLKIAAFMNLDPSETSELLEAYRLTKIGWNIYYQRKNVLEFLLNFTDFHHESNSCSTPPRKIFRTLPSENRNSSPDSVVLNSRLALSTAIQQMLLSAISKPDETICLLAQPEHLEALSIAAFLPHCDNDIKIKHIFCINNSASVIKSQQNYNIQCFKKIIPFFGTAFEYLPYYYYDNVNSHFNNLTFMPCIFLTSDSMILASADLNEGILLKNGEVLKLCEKRIEGLLQNCQPLALELSSNLQIHLETVPSIYADTVDLYGLSAEPCLMPMLTPELIEKYMIKTLPHRDVLLDSLRKYMKSFYTSRLNSYFTREGALRFLKTGRLHEIPSQLYTPLSYPDRIFLLKRLCDHIENTNYMRLLKGKLDKFPLNLHILVGSNYGYLIFSAESQNLSCIHLKEQNILSSFYDFAYTLEENDFLETKEETLSFLRELISVKQYDAV
ncbi:MAG: hypothetical protein KH828_04680 [Clostridiales bacterium]|nr:hypothetical protein [Clostridiales bacterium]